MRSVAACVLIVTSLLTGDALAQRDGGGGGFARGGQNAQRGGEATRPGTETRSYLFEPTGTQMKYAVFVPRKLDKSKPAPLIILLHGYSVTPESILGSFAAAADRHGYIVAAPTGYTLGGWYGYSGQNGPPADPETARLSELDVMNVLGIMRAAYSIDPRRIYIAGHSMGGFGAVYLAIKHPDIWAAVGAMSPGFTPAAMEVINTYGTIPIVVEHGDKDEIIPVSLVRGWVARLAQ